MTTVVEELSQRALSLSVEDRARLADELLASLEGPADADTEAAWQTEIARRVEEIKGGKSELIPADEVFAETARIYKK
jgi:putative addiction module component (TIGR02574 family)